jgi:circadian clock protein KaiC
MEDKALDDATRNGVTRGNHLPGEEVVRPVTKNATGITGFDEVTGGGLPQNRLTAIVGGTGAGKTVFALQTIVNRLRHADEPGIFVAFEEPVGNVRQNVASFDWNLADIPDLTLQFLDANIPVDAVLGGAFDLTGLLSSLSQIKTEIGAKNIVFDGIDMLLSNLQDEHLERRELARLNEWVHESAMSALMTVKSFGTGDRDRLRSDFVQFMTDCVVQLDATRTATTTSRSLRIVKYRGSGFAANPAPLVIGSSGLNVVAFRGTRLNYPTFTDRVSSGIAGLDMLLTGGYLRGSSILISGSPGTSKTSLGASFVAASCARGEKALFVSFDESADQIVANMVSIGIDLTSHIEAGHLSMCSLISAGRSPEEHFVTIQSQLQTHDPKFLVIDPLSSLLTAEYPFTDLICESLIGEAKLRGITVLCTSLLDNVTGEREMAAAKVSTVADTWIHVTYLAQDGERNRALTIIKSRGTGHSHQVRELVLSHSGIDLVNVYVAEGEVLMGSARIQKEEAEHEGRTHDVLAYHRARMNLDQDVAGLQTQMAAISAELDRKRQETVFLETSETDRVGRQEAAAAARLGGRQAGPAQTEAGDVPTRRRRQPK